MKNIPYYEAAEYTGFYEMLHALYQKQPQKTAVKYRRNKILYSVTYYDLIGEISSLYRYYQRNGVRDRHIGILSENRYEYIPIYLSSAFGNVIAPIDRETTADMLQRLLDGFDIQVLFYTDKTKDKIAGLARTQGVRLINIDADYPELIRNGSDIDSFFDRIRNTDPDRFAVLAFTSGTTGETKGVMLSQRNIVSNLRAALQNNRLKTPTLQALPMNHTYGFNPGVLTPLCNGDTVCINMDLKELSKDFKYYNPYYIGIVPMMAEGIYNNILREARRRKRDKTLNRMIRISNALRKIGIDVRKLFFGNLINRRLKLISCGGASLNPFYVEKFEELGIKLLNGYGLTECSPLVAVNREVHNVAGSVGTVVAGTEVRIDDDGEILVKGPNVMLGYYKDETATREAMANGWYRTGDLGVLEDGVLYITGRKKNLIILENGKNVSPEAIEKELMKLPYVKECLVVLRQNKGRGVLLAILLTDGDRAGIEEDIEKINASLPAYMQIGAYEFAERAFEKTSTQKIIRSSYV